MLLFRLKRKDRVLMADVASMVQNMIAQQDLGVDLAREYWRISMYAKLGYLKDQDVRDILQQMEVFSEVIKKNPKKDPNGDYADIDGVIERLRALMKQKNVSETRSQKELEEWEKKQL